LGEHIGWFAQSSFDRIWFGFYNIADNYSIAVDAVDYSWSEEYYTNRNWNFSPLVLSIDYRGEYSFTEDVVGATPNGWTVDEPGTSHARVLSEKAEHAKVVELTRTSTDGASMTNIFGAKSASVGHEIEFWMWGENNSQGILDVQNGGAGFQSKIWLWMNF